MNSNAITAWIAFSYARFIACMLTPMDWERELTVQIGRAVDARRQELGLSAQALSDKTAELGHKISRSAIADYSNENRRPRVSVADLLVLARALDMPPLYLLFPNPAGETVTYLPGEHDASGYGALRFVGMVEGYTSDDRYRNVYNALISYLTEARGSQPLETLKEKYGAEVGALLYKDSLKSLQVTGGEVLRVAALLGIPIGLDVSQSPLVEHLPDEFRRDNGAD
ncbi:hypothetical protein HMPREF2860_05130 [Corynebacterium sp. HMSC064E10]|nr:hypothetical protein HMPREF2860_05130 [Corynebacterium sp. HMSC064E10]